MLYEVQLQSAAQCWKLRINAEPIKNFVAELGVGSGAITLFHLGRRGVTCAFVHRLTQVGCALVGVIFHHDARDFFVALYSVLNKEHLRRDVKRVHDFLVLRRNGLAANECDLIVANFDLVLLFAPGLAKGDEIRLSRLFGHYSLFLF